MLTFGNYLSEKTYDSEEHTPPKDNSSNNEKIQDDKDFVKKKNKKNSCRNQQDDDQIDKSSQNTQKYVIELSEKSKELGSIIGLAEEIKNKELKEQDTHNIKQIQAEGNNGLLIMSPKNMKKRIEIMDFEKVEKESNEKERKMWQQNVKYPDSVSEWMSPSNSAVIKKLKAEREVKKDQNDNIMDLRSASFQLLDLVLSLAIPYGLSYLEENKSDNSSEQNGSNLQDETTLKGIGIGFMGVLIICQIVVGKMLNLSRNLTQGLMLCFQVGTFICYSEFRVVQLRQQVISCTEESNVFLEMILIGGIIYGSFQQLLQNQKFLNKSSSFQSQQNFSSKAYEGIKLLICLSLVGYMLVRLYSTVKTFSHVGIFLGLIVLAKLLLVDKSPLKFLSKTKEHINQEGDQTNNNVNATSNKNNFMNFNISHTTNNNNLLQMFSPKFGGFQAVMSARNDKKPEFGGYFFNGKKQVISSASAAAAAASFAPATNQLSSNEDKNLLKQKSISSDKNSSKNTSNNSNNKPTSASIMSPTVFNSVQCESPRDMLDSHRDMFDSHRAIFLDTKDQNDGEVGELEKAAAMYAEKNWGGKQNEEQMDLQEDQEEEEEQARRNKEKDIQQIEQNQDEDEEGDEEGLDIDLSENNNNGNVSLFNGERSDTIREPTNASAINIKTQDQHEPSAVNINQEEIMWRLAMQDLILHSVNEGIIVIRKDSSEVIYANRQACHLLGTSIQYILPTLLSLRNVLSYKDEVLNFSEILQQFDKPPELSDLLNLRGMFSNLYNKREIMICVGQGANYNQGKQQQEQYFSHNHTGHQQVEDNDTSFPGYSNSNNTNMHILNSNNTDNHEVSFNNLQSQNDNSNNQNIKKQEFTSVNPSIFQQGQEHQNSDSQNKFSFHEQSNQKFTSSSLSSQGGFNQGNISNEQHPKYSNQHIHNNNSSIKAFFDTNSFIAVEMEVVLGNFNEKYVVTTLRRMGWMNPLCAIHSSTLKVQYFIRKMISELSVDMNDMKDYFMNAKLQPNSEVKVDVAGCLGKLECMAEFLQDFSTSSLIFSGTFMPMRAPLNLPALIGGVLNKISSRTANEAYKFTLEYDRSCPDVIFSDAKRLERVFYNLLLYFVDTNEQASVVIKVSSLQLLTNPDNKRIRVKQRRKKNH